jgi:hypothetical protein
MDGVESSARTRGSSSPQPRLKFRWVRHKKKTARFRTALFEPLLASQRADLFPARRKVGTKGMISIGYFSLFHNARKQAQSDLTCIASQKTRNTCTRNFIR